MKMADVKKKPHYQIIDGIRCNPMFNPECFREALNYKPQPTDIFIVTYPKCGTTWMQNIVLYLLRKGKALENPKDFHRMCPFIEPEGYQSILNMPRPGALKTHLPYNRMPYASEAKYIFVLRNPKDCCVSFYYHTKRDAFQYSDGEFEDFFEIFMTGEVEYNDYFDHLASWYHHRNDKQLFHTTYEDMKEDLRGIILLLGNFLGHEYIEAIEKDNGILNNVLHLSSFEYMKSNLSEHFDNVRKRKGTNQPCASSHTEKDRPSGHFRKGVVGDWVNHFSLEQSERLNQKFLERFGSTEIYEKYKNFF